MSAQLDLICRVPKQGTDCYELLCALQRGERLTELQATLRYHITAASQRLGDLRRKFGWPVQSRWIETEGGKTCKEYYL